MIRVVYTLAGSAILLGAAFLWGCERTSKEKKKLSIIGELNSLVRYIESHIRNFRTPLFDIYEQYSSKELMKCGFIETMRADGFLAAVSKVEGILPVETVDHLKKFGKMIGNGYEKEQSELCLFLSEQLLAKEKKLYGELPKKVKMYRLLPVLLAVTVIILLL